MAQALGIHSGWTEIFAVNLHQLQGYQGKAVQICAGMDWNNKQDSSLRKAMCMKHFRQIHGVNTSMVKRSIEPHHSTDVTTLHTRRSHNGENLEN